MTEQPEGGSMGPGPGQPTAGVTYYGANGKPAASAYEQPGAYQPVAPGMVPRYIPQARTDGLCIASLVLGILGFSLLAIVFGVIGKRRIKETRAKGSSLATAGIVLGAGWLVLGAGAMLAITLAPGSTSSTGAIERTATGSIASGQCLAESVSRLADAQAVPCSEPHAMQVFTTMDLGDEVSAGTYQDVAPGKCQAMAPLLIDSSRAPGDLTISAFGPSAEEWRKGERQITCTAEDAKGAKLTGSLMRNATAS